MHRFAISNGCIGELDRPLHAPPLEILYDGIVNRQEFTANAGHLANPNGVPLQTIHLLDVKQSKDITREKWDYGVYKHAPTSYFGFE